MRRRLKNRLRMLTNVLEHFDAHPDAWAAHAPIPPEVDAVRATRDAIRDGAEAQAAGDTTGHTDARDRARADATDRLVDLGLRVRPYARTTANDPLLTAWRHAPSDWDKRGLDDFAADANAAFSQTAPHLTDLSPYGVTAEALGAARDAVAEVARLTAARDAVAIDAEEATDGLGGAYPAVLPHLANLDDLVPALVADPSFVAQYAHARQIPGD